MRKINSKSKSKSRLKHLLIFFVRFLTFSSLIFLIYFFFVDSTTPSYAYDQSVLIDNTPSMSIETDDRSPIEIAEKLIEGLNVDTNRKEPSASKYGRQFLYLNQSLNSKLDLISRHSTLISDFQGVSLEKLSHILKDTTSFKNLVLLGQVAKYKNIFIDSLSVDYNVNDFSKQRITLYPSASTYFKDGIVVFRLFHGNRQLASIVKNTNDLGKVTIDIPFDIKGELLIQLEGDDVYYDNEFRFVIAEKKRPIISIIDGEKNDYLESVFDNKNLFYVNKMDSKSVDYEQIKSSDIIIMNSLNTFPTGLKSQISDKTVMVFAPDKANDFENDWIHVTSNPKNDSARYEFDIDFDHPLFSGIFENTSDVSDLPSGQSIYNVSGNFELIISLRNGDPLLLKDIKRNHYFFNTKLDLNYTNFPIHSIFLPLLYKMALSSVSYDDRTYYYPNDLAYLNVDNKEIPPKILSENFEIIPEFNPTSKGITFRVPFIEPGFYTLSQDQDTFKIAINMDKEESIMNALTLDDLITNFGSLNHVSIQSQSTLPNIAANQEHWKWKYALILTLFLLLTETLFHKYLQ